GLPLARGLPDRVPAVARPPAGRPRSGRAACRDVGGTGMTPATADGLRGIGLDPGAVAEIVDRALVEDLGPDRLDVTSVATVPAGQIDVGDLVARAHGVVAGLPVAAAVFDLASAGSVTFTAKAPEGGVVRRGDLLATFDG